MKMKQNRTLTSVGQIYTPDGYKQNMFDFLAIKPYVEMHYDFSTKNISFLNMHVLLKKLGVKNNKEMLLIFNKDLIGLDPYSPVLTNAQKAAIEQEIRINPWYYFREVITVTVNDKQVPFRLGLESFSCIFFQLRRQSILMEAPRQVGKTITLTAMGGWALIFGGINLHLANLHYKESEAAKNLRLIKDMLDNLPSYLQYHNKIFGKEDKNGNKTIKTVPKSSEKITSLHCKVFNNVIDSFLVGTSETTAQATGRGRTIPIWMIDEWAHIKFNNLAFKSFGQAYKGISAAAKKDGKLFGMWMLCTPGDLKTKHGMWLYEKIVTDYLHFNSRHYKMFDMEEEEINEYLSKECRGSTIFIDCKFYELGYDEKWLQARSKDEDVSTIRTELLLKWEIQTDSSPFTAGILNKLETLAEVREQTHKTLPLDDYGNMLEIFPRDNDLSNSIRSFLYSYKDGIVIGIDTAYGVGGNGDSHTMVGVDPVTLNVIFTYERNDIPVEDLALLIIDIIEHYIIPDGLNVAFAIERNATGRSLINILKKYPEYARYLVVYPVPKEKLNDPTIITDYTFNHKGQSLTCNIGLTVSSNRTELITILQKVVAKHTSAIAVKPIVDQIKTLVTKRTASQLERIEHADGKHDDLVFGAIHAYYAIYYNAEFLFARNNITIDPSTFVLNEGMVAINTTGKINRRITASYYSENGHLKAVYFDNKLHKYVDEKTAQDLILEDKDKALIRTINNVETDEEVEENEQEKMVREIAAERAPEGAEIIYKDRSKPDVTQYTEEDLANWYRSLLN